MPSSVKHVVKVTAEKLYADRMKVIRIVWIAEIHTLFMTVFIQSLHNDPHTMHDVSSRNLTKYTLERTR